MREVVLTDPHAPSEFRANGVVANMDEFYAAFDVEARRQALAARRGAREDLVIAGPAGDNARV